MNRRRPAAAPNQARAAFGWIPVRLDVRGPQPAFEGGIRGRMELERHLLRDVGRAIAEHDLINDGDRTASPCRW